MTDLESAPKSSAFSTSGTSRDDAGPDRAPIQPSAPPPTPSWAGRLLAIALAPLPGLGLVILGRHLKGSLYFVLFFITLNGAFLNLILDDRGELRTFIVLLVALAGLLWIIALIDLILTVVFSRALDPEERNSRFVAGVAHYLRDELPEARSLFSRLLARNPADAPVGIQLASVYRRMGRLSRARRLLRRCHRLDRRRIWEYEILSRLRRLDRMKRSAR